MGRTKGTYTLTSNIEPKVGAPLDARTVVPLKTDLTANGTFDYPYIGLSVFVREDNKRYTLIGTDPTVAANWREEGSGTSTSADHVTYDNTTSELESTNVQDALDEVVGSLGTAAGKDYTNQVTEDSEDLITSGAVYDALENLPSDDTWRSIQVNGTEVQDGTNSSGPLKLVNGTNTTVAFDSTNKTIQVNATDTNTTYSLTQDQSDGHKITLTPSSGTAQTITIPDNDTKVTSSANHYTPATASGQDKSANASGATAAWSIDVVKGVTLNTDGKGHVTGLSVTSGKIPGNPNTDEKVKQTPSTTNSNFEVLFSGTADNTEHIEGTKKTTTLRFNPSLGALMEGDSTVASGDYSHAEGGMTTASGIYSHAAGYYTCASGAGAHAEGGYTTADDVTPGNTASGDNSHAEGLSTTASGENSHAEGFRTSASGFASHAEGGYYVEGRVIPGGCASGAGSHAEGLQTIASGVLSHTEGENTTASGFASHTEGSSTKASGTNSHTEGGFVLASGTDSHAEGDHTTASGFASHTEGCGSIAEGDQSHAEGEYTTASGLDAHAEGMVTSASGDASHAEGYFTKASGYGAHAEGGFGRDIFDETGNTASGNSSHAEGYATIASGFTSHAEGNSSTAKGEASHASGTGTCAAGNNQTVVGKYNVADTTSLFIVGNGTANNARSNALSVNSDNTTTLGASGTITSGNTKAVTGGAVYTALGNKLDASLKGAANGVAELDSTGKVPSSQLPSYVDDVIEVADYAHLPITGESGKIYVTLDTNKTYRWSGTGYTEISESLALGETESTAYRGDRGKTAYNHATETKLSTATASGLYKVASTAQGHIASLTAVQKSDITALGIPGSDTNTTYSLTQDSSDGHKITLTPSSGTAQTLTIPDNNTTYTFANGTNGFTVTPSGGTAQTVTVTPSITNNVTGSGTSGYLTKFNGANTITNGPQLGSSTTTYLRNDGSWATPTGTTYTAGTGLKLSGTQFLTNVPRISNGDLNYKPGVNTFNIQEYSNGSTNVPENKWQHTLTIEGSDSNYTTQLSLGMTNAPSAYYRRMDSNNYSEWYRLTNALLQRYETGTITNGTWYRLFTINYTSYSYLHLRVLVKAGYTNLYEAFICVRYTPNGMDGEYTSIRVIGSQPTTKNLVLYKTSDTAIALAVCCDGAGSTMGFEIHDMHNESNTIKAENVSVENPFVALSARPTTFGKHYYLTGDYSDLVNKPSLNYLPLSGGTMTGVITAKASVYEDSYSGALNMNNSNIYGLNSIYTADTADTAAEGIHFYRDATHVDTLWMCNGDLLFVPNRALGTSTSKADSQKVGRFTANPTSGQVVITDGTTGGMKSSGYTIAASVPSGAKFTDTTYTFAGGTNSFTVTPSGASAQTVSITVSDSTKLPLTGGSLSGGLEVKGIIAGDTGSTGHGLWGGGGYHNAYNNIILHGDNQTGTSGIAFVSDKSDGTTITNINQPSDRAFIQYHAYGITTATAESTNPTLATTGEAGRFVVGVGNDSTDQLWLQTPARTGLIHQVGATSYVIPDTNNTTGSVGSATQPVYVDGGAIKGCTYSLNATVPSGAVFTDTHRPIQMNGTEILGNNTTALNLKAGSNVTLSNDGGTVTINSSYTNTDVNVTQTATSTNANYEVLFSATADNTTRTETARKNSNLLFNPSTGVLYGPNEMRARDLSVSANNGTSGGISLYSTSSNMDNYGIYFRQTSNKEKHGYVQGDWATYFTMNDQDNRGWVFRRNKTTGNVASIDTKGNVVANGSVTVGGNTTNTSGCRMVYDSTNECMNLEFAS